jgi:hypothetical protein
MSARKGVSVLAIVLILGVIGGIASMAYTDLWRGSSRTLFSVQEHRELVNLARSTLAEAHYALQVKLDRAEPEWFDWCIKRRKVPPRQIDTQLSHQNAAAMTENPDYLKYEVGEVTAVRVQELHAYSRPDEQGIIDLTVRVSVRRTSPRHEAALSMTQRHTFRLAENGGGKAGVGRYIEMDQVPAGTAIEGD